MLATSFDDFFREAPSCVDVVAIRQQWLALTPAYDVNCWQLPLPLWARRAYDHSGRQAWQNLQHDLAVVNSNQALCIYLHIPFCSSKCGFCDSYSFRLANHVDENMQTYLDCLCTELRLWGQQGNLAKRPVSTVHLGGGTPTFLGERRLAQLVAIIRENYAVSDITEWALESSVESLSPSMMATMHELGYRRLHIGVQSLESAVRVAIGRRCTPEAVMRSVEAALEHGWVVSVDLLCGLPFQTLDGFIRGIEALISAGVDGFSLYELLIYPQNRRWAEKYGLTERSHIPNYLMFQAGASCLTGHGYQKNLFNHWANQRDQNIYFTFPTRGEDCLALGAIADGVMGNYHYRHPRYSAYLQTTNAENPGLEGGLRRRPHEEYQQPLVTAILSGHIPATLVSHLPDRVSRWLHYRLVEADSSGDLHLTTNGTWFAGNLVAEI